MCKHILINDFQLTDLELLKEFESRTNEQDGFGAILRLKSGNIETLKSLSQGSFYIDLTKRLCEGDIITLVVHHRTSTNGLGLDYAHPFVHDGNYLTHNGVVSIPGKYNTKTENDSEALLHHLVATDYQTNTIEGYFSCFIVNDKETRVLVDSLAPIYTDGRIYSSHKLNDSFEKIELQLRILDPKSGQVVANQPVVVMESTYGQDLAHLSLGEEYTRDKYSSQVVIDFFDIITDFELDQLIYARGAERYDLIKELSWSIGLEASQQDLIDIETYIENMEYEERKAREAI
jgi:predicted glutamine amidotransferase